MDLTARRVLVTVLKRLRHEEKLRYEMIGIIRALAESVCSDNPELQRKYQAQRAIHEQTLRAQLLHLEGLFDGLIDALENPDPLEKDEQEKLRQILESFEGPIQ